MKDKRKRNNKSTKLNRKKKRKKKKNKRHTDGMILGVLGVDRRAPVSSSQAIKQPTSEERTEIKARDKEETWRSRERKGESDV